MSLSTHRSYMTWDWPGICLEFAWNWPGIDLEFAWNRAKKSHLFFLPGFCPKWPGITRGWLRIWHLIYIYFNLTEVGIYLESHQIPSILPGSGRNQWGRVKYWGKVTESSNPQASWMWPPLWLSPRCPTLGTFHMLSQTLQPLSHVLPLILYHHHLTSSSSRVTLMLLIAHQSKFCRKLVVIASRISTIQQQTNE